MDLIFHITSRREADEANLSGTYVPRDFEREGFVHCSYRHQLPGVADRLFRGHTDLVVLQIDPSRLTAPVIHENLEAGRSCSLTSMVLFLWQPLWKYIHSRRNQSALDTAATSNSVLD